MPSKLRQPLAQRCARARAVASPRPAAHDGASATQPRAAAADTHHRSRRHPSPLHHTAGAGAASAAPALAGRRSRDPRCSFRTAFSPISGPACRGQRGNVLLEERAMMHRSLLSGVSPLAVGACACNQSKRSACPCAGGPAAGAAPSRVVVVVVVAARPSSSSYDCAEPTRLKACC